MNKLTKFFHELLHPHCPDCQIELRDSLICDSCENLKTENARLAQENERLLNLVLRDKESVQVTQVPTPININKIPTNVPWAVRRQMLEQEDRERAKLLRDAPKTDNVVEGLEQELGIAESQRENQTGIN